LRLTCYAAAGERSGWVLSPGVLRALGSVTRSPESPLFERRTGRGGPTPPLAREEPPAPPTRSAPPETRDAEHAARSPG